MSRHAHLFELWRQFELAATAWDVCLGGTSPDTRYRIWEMRAETLARFRTAMQEFALFPDDEVPWVD